MSVDKSTGPVRPAVTEADAQRAIAEAARGALGDIEPTLVRPEIASLPPHARSLDLQALATRLGLPVDALLRMDSNENALGPSPIAMEAAQSALQSAHRYPDAHTKQLRRALAERHGVGEDHLVIGHGVTELIELLVRTFAGTGETVVSAWPTFPMYRLAALAVGRESLNAPLQKDRVDLSAVAALVDRRAKLVFIANPNNPTGTYVPRRQLIAFLNRIPDSVIVVLDEAYQEYVTAPDYPDGIRDFQGRKRIVVLRTFSKIHGLAGLRVGYAVMDPALARFVDAVRQPFNVNAVAQAAALGALEDEAHVRASHRTCAAEREELSGALTKLGLSVVPSQTNFLMVRFERPEEAHRVAEGLLTQGILTRSMRAYELPEALRITLGTRSMNLRLLEAISGLRSGNGLGQTKVDGK